MSQEDADEAELKARLSLDGQAGPAQRISKERARELVRLSLAAVPELGLRRDGARSLAGESGETPPTARWFSRSWVAAAALLLSFLSGASAAIMWWGKREAPAPAPLSAPRKQVKAAPARDPVVEAPTWAPEQDTEEPSPEPDPTRAQREAVSSRVRRPELPDDLLQRANQLRAEGAFGGAQERYEEVFRRYPGSLSAYAAQVAAGSLALEHLHQPEQARRLFEAALKARPEGALSLEALVGLAASYASLRQPREERRALTRLLAAYPNSNAADRARARLFSLDRERGGAP